MSIVDQVYAPDASEYVYIIAHIRDGKFAAPIKVGMSRLPDARLLGLQTGNPRKLGIVHRFLFPSRRLAKHAEWNFHNAMADHRLEGEWFDVPPKEAVGLMCLNVRCMVEIPYEQAEGTVAWAEMLVAAGAIIDSEKPEHEEADGRAWAWQVLDL